MLVSESQRTEELAGLALASASISSSLDLNKVLRVVARQLSNLLDVQICIISDWQKSSNGLSPSLEFASSVHVQGEIGFRPRPVAKQFQAFHSLEEHQVLQVRSDDSALSDSEVAAMEAAGISTLLLLPLVSHGKTIGLVELQDTRAPRRFNEQELYLAQTLCQQAAIAIENAHLFESTQRQLDELKILKEVAVAGTEATDEDELIREATELIRESLYPDNFGILLLAENKQELLMHSSYEAEESIKDNRVHLGKGVTGRVAKNGKALRIADTSREKAYLGFDQITRSELCVPMKIGERIIGVVNAESRHLDHFSEADERLIQTFAGQLASGIERLRRETAEQRKTAQLKVLNELAGEMGGILEREKLFHLVVERLHDHMGYLAAFIFSVDEERKEIVMEAMQGSVKEFDSKQPYRQALHEGLLGKAALNAMTVDSNNVKEDGDYIEVAGFEKVGSELVVPILVDERVAALLSVYHEEINSFDEDEIATIKTLTEQISIALERANHFDATRHQLQELSVLHAIANVAVSAKNEDELLERATEVIGANLYPDNFGFLMLDESGENLLVQRSYRGVKKMARGTSLPLNEGISGQVAASGKAWRVPDVREEPSYIKANEKMLSELTVPIAGSQKVLGVINAESAELDWFTDADMRLLSTIAGQLGTAIDKLRLFEAERLQRRQAETLQEVAAILGATSEMSTVSDLILDQLAHVVPFDSASIQIVEGEVLVIRAVAGRHRKKIIGQKLRIEEDKIAHPIIKQHQTVLHEDINNNPDWLLVPGSRKVKSWIGAPLIVRGECVGVLTVDSYKKKQFDQSDAQLVSSFAIHAGIAIENARLFEELEGSYTQTVSALANAIDIRDSYTIGHSQRLADLAAEIGRVLNFTEKELEDTHWAALLHDIGKIGIPDDILRKPSALDARELDIIRRHPEIGAHIVEPIKNLAHLAPIIRAHQEQYDGNGYPDGLSGEEIPIIARIISVADAYVAMTDERVYREARSKAKAVEEIKRHSGSQFDPKVVEAFLQVLDSN